MSDDLAAPVAEEQPPAEEPAPRRSRLGLVLAILAAVLLLAVVVTVPYAVKLYRVATTPTLDDVKIYEARSDHTDQEVDYDPAPAPGGPHDPEWEDCGVYDEPPREENVQHSLEHGTLWLTYDPDEVEAEDVAALEEVLPQRGILSPYPGQSAPVIATVWGAQLELDGADDRRLPLFIEKYADGHTAPEPMMSCAGGVRRLESEDAGGGDGVNV